MKPSLFNTTAAPSKVHSLLDRRYAERVVLRHRITFIVTEGAGSVQKEGFLQDLSQTGCKAFSVTPPEAGEIVTLCLHLEDGKDPLSLAGATIAWVAGHSFAVKFPILAPEIRKRLQETIWKRVTLSESKNHRTAFRIAL